MKMGFSYVGMRSLMQALYDLSNGEHWRGEARSVRYIGSQRLWPHQGHRENGGTGRYRRVELLANRGHHLPQVYRRRALALGQRDLATIMN